jgi:prophage antirepressor-like protein
MNEIQLFDDPEFGEIRTKEINGEPWFSATDVARALGYTNPRDAIVRHCKPTGVVNHDVGVWPKEVQNSIYSSIGNFYSQQHDEIQRSICERS